MTRHNLMLVPSLACQAKCAYCFGPNRGPVMSPGVFDAALDWIDALVPTGDRIELTFHGGEPLLAGHRWYERNLPLLRARLGDRLGLHLQSNLWLLDDDYCTLFKVHDVSIGTSLDGPEHINDAQRGKGYFGRTMNGIRTARRNGLDSGAICTFTRLSVPHYQEVFDFFANEHLSFSVHAAVATLQSQTHAKNSLAMSPDEHADLFCRLFDHYVAHMERVQISTFDTMARGVSSGNGGICTFGNCLGHYLTVGPAGEIYSCNRFLSHPEWMLGSVFDKPDRETLSRSPAWQRLAEREASVHEDCGDCPHFDYCHGGCAYNAAVTGSNDRRDPHCPAYRQLFGHITDCALAEVFSEDNLDAVVASGPSSQGLLRKGKLLQVMRGGPHPQKVAGRAREVVAAAALAVSDSPDEALHKLDRAGVIREPDRALQSLTALQARLEGQAQQGLLNAYLHVTYGCNLECTHCYARSGPGTSPSMAVDDLVDLVRQAASAGFLKVVLTGGEPLAHPQRDTLLDALAKLRQEIKPLQTVLRTNLAYPISPALLERLAHSTDQVVVSVDGDQASHDARRGGCSYARTVANLRLLADAIASSASEGPVELGITAVLTAGQMEGPEGDAVRALGQDLDVRVRFKAVLPLGRGADLELAPAFYSSLDDEAESIAYGTGPISTCGLGMNLYIAPDGECHPCYALMGSDHRLGNALQGGLEPVLAQNDAYRGVTVDSNAQCGHCALRYLCGGFCRAWGTGSDPDAPPRDCGALYARAQTKLQSALAVLDIATDAWTAAELPAPDDP